MKHQVQRVDIEIGINSQHVQRIQIMRYQPPPYSVTDICYHWHAYPIAERNYWRAVGMQLRLAGFAKPEIEEDGER